MRFVLCTVGCNSRTIVGELQRRKRIVALSDCRLNAVCSAPVAQRRIVFLCLCTLGRAGSSALLFAGQLQTRVFAKAKRLCVLFQIFTADQSAGLKEK